MSDINQNYKADLGPKKRVLFIITQSEMGGAQRFVFEVVSRLNKEKYNVLVAVGSDGGGEFLKQLGSANIPNKTINSLKRNISPIQDFKAIFEIRKLVSEFCPDTFFLNSSKAGFIGSLAAKLQVTSYKLQVIYRIGGWSFNDPWPTWKKKFWLILEKISAPWKDIIIVNNKHDLDQAKTLGIKPRGQILLIHNGIDTYKLELLPKEEAMLRLFEKIAKYSGKIFQAETIVGTIANLYPTKDILSLVRTAEYFKKNNSVVFIVIGDGSERPNIEKLIKGLDLEHKVLLLGQLTDAKKYLPAFDIFVLPSVKEGFPWSLIEAMAAKLPVIATRVGAIEEIIDDQKNGLIIEPRNPNQIADKIKLILSDDRIKQELGIQAHQKILFKFSLEKMFHEVEELL